MDGKGMPRSSSHHSSASSYDSLPASSRKHRKPKRSQNVLADGNGRSHGHVPSSHHHHHEPQYPQNPLFHNRSLSMISTLHHLNPHRKVAMSPEILREAEEQASTLKKAVKQLQEQLEKANREKARIHRFLSDLLYTLNARGYETVKDHEGTVVDLNKCKGETYLDLIGRDLKQRGNVRRQGGQELLLKAVIGNQERAIQTLVYKLDSIGRDILMGNRFSLDDNYSLDSPRSAGQENAKVASLESEVLQLVNLIEGACQKCPEMYPALRDHYYGHEDGAVSAEMSPRNPVIQNLLKKCEQISGEAQARQLVDMIISATPNKLSTRPKSRQNGSSCGGSSSSARSTPKLSKTKSESKARLSNHSIKAPRAVASDTVSVAGSQGNHNIAEMYCPILPPPPRSADSRGYDDHLKPLNGQSKSDSSVRNKGVSARASRSCTPNSSVHGSRHNRGEPTGSGGQGGYGKYSGTDQSLIHECSVTVCPYCHLKFGLVESVSEIKNHIEMHIYAGDKPVARI